MFSLVSISSTLFFLMTAQAAAIPKSCHAVSNPSPAGNISITEAQLTQIMPATASCATASFVDECRYATQAAPFVTKAFSDYNITTSGEQAALLSLMLFESGGFQFNTNQ